MTVIRKGAKIESIKRDGKLTEHERGCEAFAERGAKIECRRYANSEGIRSLHRNSLSECNGRKIKVTEARV
mgnify:CR=1 FL=1